MTNIISVEDNRIDSLLQDIWYCTFTFRQLKRQLQYLEAKLVENVNQIWNVGQSGYQTLGSRRSLASGREVTVMASQ